MEESGDRDAHGDVPSLHRLEDSPTGSPTTAVPSLAELENCVSNLSLAHEIVVNSDFRFDQSRPPADSLQGRVMEMVHRAFWDRLREELAATPPDYSHALTLLEELKTTLLSLLLPRHVRLRGQVDEVLDLVLLRQQAAHGALDLPRLAAYITSTMATLCAPVRDPDIQELRSLHDPVDILRETFRVLGLMKTDMANFTVQMLRPHLQQQAVLYERTKFQQILDQQPDSLDRTTAWLRGAAEEERAACAQSGPDGTSSPPRPVSPTAVLHRAYLTLLQWDTHNQLYPETVLMDRTRLDSLGRRRSLLVLQAAVLLLTSTQCGGAVASLQGFVGKLKQTTTALLEGSHCRGFDLQGALLGLAEQVLLQVSVAMATVGGPLLSAAGEELLKRQICDLAKDDNPVLLLIGERVQGYLQAMLEAGSSPRRPEVPPALRVIGCELSDLAAALTSILTFNRSVFGPFYAPILRGALFPQGEAEVGEDSR